jgi:hypothetical protein
MFNAGPGDGSDPDTWAGLRGGIPDGAEGGSQERAHEVPLRQPDSRVGQTPAYPRQVPFREWSTTPTRTPLVPSSASSLST